MYLFGIHLKAIQIKIKNNIFPGSSKMLLYIIDSLKYKLNGSAQCINVHILSWC